MKVCHVVVVKVFVCEGEALRLWCEGLREAFM